MKAVFIALALFFIIIITLATIALLGTHDSNFIEVIVMSVLGLFFTYQGTCSYSRRKKRKIDTM